MGVRWRIVFAMVSLSMLIIAVMGLFSLNNASKVIETRAQEFMTVFVERSKYELNQQVTVTQNNTRAIYEDFRVSYNADLASTDPSYLALYLSKIKPAIKLSSELNASKIAYLLITDPLNPAVVLGSVCFMDDNRDGIPEEVALDKLLSIIQRDKGTLLSGSTIQFNWATEPENPYVSCFVLAEREGRQAALMGTAIKKDFMIDRIKLVKYLNSGFVFLTDEKAKIVFHPSLEQGVLFDALTRANQIFEKHEDKRKVQFLIQKDEQGEEVMFSALSLINGWYLGLQVNSADIYEGLDGMVWGIAIVALGTLVLALLVGALAAKKISEPYVELTQEMKKVAKGSYDVNLKIHHLERTDEAGVLSRTFSDMVKQLKKSFDEIQAYNLNLKNLVESRTQELRQTNDHLEEALAETEEKQELLQKSIETIEQTQRELSRVEKIASLTYLVAGVAHKINTPLGNALTSASFLQTKVNGLNKQYADATLNRTELENYIQSAQLASVGLMTNLEKSIQLVDRFKEIAVLRPEGIAVKRSFIELIEEQWLLARHRHGGENSALVIEGDRTLRFNCVGNSLSRIFSELMDNSLTHRVDSKTDLEIKIRIRPLEGESGGFEVFYSDNGVGIAKEQLDKMFTPFYTTKMSKDHDGLGLNVIYNLVIGIFRGDISIDESLEQGLGFHIVLYENQTREDGQI